MSWREAEKTYTDDVIGEEPIPQLIEASSKRHTDRVAQRYKGGVYDRTLTPDPIPEAPQGTFNELTYGEFRHVLRRLASGFRSLGLERGNRVGIFSSTRMEWALSDLALLAAGGVVTTIYENSSSDMARYLLDDAGAIGVIVEDGEKLERILSVNEELSLAFIVTIDAIEIDTEAPVITLAEVYERGADEFDRSAYEQWIADTDGEDLASIIYTSGTTGRPKGVQLTHDNLRSNLNQIRKRYGPRPDKPADLPRIDASTRSVSFLPLAHIFERTAGHFTMFAAGASVTYAESPDTLQEDFQAVQPSVATSVPRVYEKIYAAIREQASESPIKERIFHWAVDVGQAYHRADQPGGVLRLKRRIADRLVFAKVKSALGGEIEMLISGGGSLSADLCALYHGMGLPIFEGYGLTETAPVATCNPVEEPKIGTIGPPVVDMEVRIDESVAPADEFGEETGTVGELLLRGPNVSPGYWERPEETAASFDDDGWFRTGDIVLERPDDYLVFIERVKQVIVLSTGKNVAPGPIEDRFAPRELVEQCMVIGDGEKFVGALIVPNDDALDEWAVSAGHDLPSDPHERVRDERVRSRIQEEVDTINEEFEAHETIKQFALVPQEFTEERGLLTPTMKKRRERILDAYEDEVDAIYAEE